MADKLSPQVSPDGIQVKRLNRLPILIVFVIGLSTMTAFAYLISQSGKRQQRVAEQEPLPYSVDQNTAKGLLAGKPDFGVIPLEPEPEVEPTVEPVQQRKPRPQPKPEPELTLEQKEIERIRQAKLRRFETALSSPIGIGNAGLGDLGGGNKGLMASTAHAASLTGTSSDPLSKMLNAREAMQTSLGPDKDPNKQQQKADFFMQDQPATEYLQHTRNKQQSPLEVKTGTVIPATMLGGLNSDLPGMILAQVSQNVYDTATGDYLLIPQGSRLVGTYDSFIAYGQNRALVAWNRIIYPDGSTLELEGMPGTDQAGYAGLEDQVDNHYFRIFGSALLISALSGMYDYSQGITSNGAFGDERTAGDTMASAVARELTQTSQMLLRKNLDIQPTIKIRPGYKLTVMVNRDIIFPAVW